MSTASCGAASSSSLRTAPSVAHRPAKPEPMTTTKSCAQHLAILGERLDWARACTPAYRRAAMLGGRIPVRRMAVDVEEVDLDPLQNLFGRSAGIGQPRVDGPTIELHPRKGPVVDAWEAQQPLGQMRFQRRAVHRFHHDSPARGHSKSVNWLAARCVGSGPAV